MIPEGSKKGKYGRELSSIPSGSGFAGDRDPSVALRLPTATIRNRFAVSKKRRPIVDRKDASPRRRERMQSNPFSINTYCLTFALKTLLPGVGSVDFQIYLDTKNLAFHPERNTKILIRPAIIAIRVLAFHPERDVKTIAVGKRSDTHGNEAPCAR